VGNEEKEDPRMKAEHRSRHPNTAKGRELAPVEQSVYQIRVKGHLGDQWADWFEGLTISQEKDGITVLTGPMADQAALHGLLVKIRNLCLPLISVDRLGRPNCGSGQTAAGE
jgi:hypothetical protein